MSMMTFREAGETAAMAVVVKAIGFPSNRDDVG